MSARDKLTRLAHDYYPSLERRDHLVHVAASNVEVELARMDFALEDFAAARAEYVAALPALTAGGATREDLENLLRAQARLHFRVDMFFVVARMLLDDITALLEQAFSPSAISLGTHKSLGKNLPRLADELAIGPVPPSLLERIEDVSARIKPFRDDFVVHRSIKNPRARPSPGVSPVDGATRLVVGWAYPVEGELPAPVVTEDPAELYEALMAYLDEVLDFIAAGAAPPTPV